MYQKEIKTKLTWNKVKNNWFLYIKIKYVKRKNINI
jgi:hypothetical protein